MIKIENLTVYYNNVKAIENINLNIEKGSIYTVIGQSGTGKSTVLKALAGINKNYEGSIYFNENKLDPRTYCIGYIPQNYGLVDWKTVEQNIMLSSKIKYGKKNIDKEFYKKLLEQLNIEKHLKSYPKNLSGGEKQRAAIARALLLKPNLLLMDEPFSALDLLTREEAQKLFLEVWEQHKVTTLLVTHHINEAIYLGQKIIVMSPSPGKVESIIENDLFGKDPYENSYLFKDMELKIRKLLRGEKDYEVK
jgi:ABC-type nitrate/sulfonate/bicarbonate transport system ATPase subunit